MKKTSQILPRVDHGVERTERCEELTGGIQSDKLQDPSHTLGDDDDIYWEEDDVSSAEEDIRPAPAVRPTSHIDEDNYSELQFGKFSLEPSIKGAQA